jgi:F0F1-type ATP synthase membrane subunit c/vacuolar-type H+-ATPase subunit K
MVKMPLLKNAVVLLAGFGAGFGSGWIFVATMDQLIANRSLKRMEGRKQKVRS